MAIENRNLPVGSRIWANYRKTRYVCTVEAGEEEGGLLFVLEDGSKHKSPSAAGSKVMGGKAVNGWRFWTVEGDEPATEPEKPKAERKARGGKKKQAKTLYKMPGQDGVADDKVRWFCSACMDAFTPGVAGEPEACPQGHRNDDPELNAPSGVTSAQEAEVTA
jgi:hypothetical protein